MKQYKIIGRNDIYQETPIEFNQPQLLSNLEIATKEVKCRKPTRCRICHDKIDIGDIALKTIQWVKNRQLYWRNSYCHNCYIELK